MPVMEIYNGFNVNDKPKLDLQAKELSAQANIVQQVNP